jgi:hypothetical protein
MTRFMSSFSFSPNDNASAEIYISIQMSHGALKDYTDTTSVDHIFTSPIMTPIDISPSLFFTPSYPSKYLSLLCRLVASVRHTCPGRR